MLTVVPKDLREAMRLLIVPSLASWQRRWAAQLSLLCSRQLCRTDKSRKRFACGGGSVLYSSNFDAAAQMDYRWFEVTH
jgi:hypothetical protein